MAGGLPPGPGKTSSTSRVDARALVGQHDRPPGASLPARLDDVVFVSNRGPLAFHFEDGVPVAGVTAGGLAGSLHPLVEGTGATWVACALTDADRAAAAAGLMRDPGFHIELVDPDPDVYRMAYDVVSNATLWFCHHHLFDGARRPRSDRHWAEAWEAYETYNRLFAERVAAVAPEGGRVLVQDYHLMLVGQQLERVRPDLSTVHFTHTPFADPSALRMLPDEVRDALLDGMAAYRTCGFHSPRWSAAYQACQRDRLGDGAGVEGSPAPPVFVSPLGTDADRLLESARSQAVVDAGAVLDELIGTGRQVIVRVDRMELSKNLLRGFWAFDELLERQPQRRGRLVFLALAYPSRQGLAEYLAYQNEVEATVARINERWGTPDWTPIVLEVEDDYPRSLAALKRYDVLLVNPVRDGMNLVAKEGPLVNERDGVLVLSREAGAFDELSPACVGVNPFDVTGTARALAAALDTAGERRRAWAEELRAIVGRRPPAVWLADQLGAAG